MLPLVPAIDRIESIDPGFYFMKIVQNGANIYLESSKTSQRTICLLNIPLKVIYGITSYRNREYWKIAFDIASLATLYWFGARSALVVDVASEAVDFASKHVFKQQQVDPLEVLGLDKSQLHDKAVITEIYQKIIFNLNQRIAAAETSPLILEQIQQIKDKVESAYKKLQ